MLTRLVVVYGLTFLSNWLTQSDIDLRTQTTIWWSGLRGGVALALALSVPELVRSGRLTEELPSLLENIRPLSSFSQRRQSQ